MIISMDVEKAWQNSTSVLDKKKKSHELRIGNSPKLRKGFYKKRKKEKKTQPTVIPNVKDWVVCP